MLNYAGKDLIQLRRIVGNLIALIQKIGDLIIFLEAFAGSGGNNIAAGFLSGNNALYHTEMFRVCQRTAAEFYNLYRISYMLNQKFRIQNVSPTVLRFRIKGYRNPYIILYENLRGLSTARIEKISAAATEFP